MMVVIVMVMVVVEMLMVAVRLMLLRFGMLALMMMPRSAQVIIVVIAQIVLVFDGRTDAPLMLPLAPRLARTNSHTGQIQRRHSSSGRPLIAHVQVVHLHIVLVPPACVNEPRLIQIWEERIKTKNPLTKLGITHRK